MFTPGKLYEVVRENFFFDDKDLMFIPLENGVKELAFYVPFKNMLDHHQLPGSWVDLHKRPIIMYDQEPLFNSAADIYKRLQMQMIKTHNHKSFQSATLGDVLSCGAFRTANFPIWCHSELNSIEIENLESSLFITCYSWWHAMVARDWFRHWQHHRSLQPRNKSSVAYRFLLYAREATGTREYRNNMVSNLQQFQSSIKYHWGQKSTVGPEASASIDCDDARDCAIHLVAETLFDTEKIYLTEKVFKPMVMSQPFILWAPPGSLRYLQNYGFKTFHPFIDESYDNEHDHEKRMHMLIDLVGDLSKKSTGEFADMYEKFLPIIQHNRRWFFDKIADICWQEMSDNISKSLDVRREYEIEYPGGQICHVLGTHPDLLACESQQTVLSNFLTGIDYGLRQTIFNRYPLLRDLK